MQRHAGMAFLFALFAAAGSLLLAVSLSKWGRFLVLGFRKSVRIGPGESTGLWLLWWAVLGIGAAGGAALTGHPLLGLTLALAFPAGRFLWAGQRRRRRVAELESSALAFFRGLQSLLRAGFSLPSSLFRLSESLDSPFAHRLRGSLDGFGRGRTLSACLGRFRTRAGVAQAGLCLDILEQAHGRGLALGPFLERVLPWLEEEKAGREKREGAVRAALGQALLASALPWSVAWYAGGSLGGFGAAALALQGVGLWVVAELARAE